MCIRDRCPSPSHIITVTARAPSEPCSVRAAQVSPQTSSPLIGRVRPATSGSSGSGSGPGPSSAQNRASSAVPRPGREWTSKTSANRAIAPMPTPRVPLPDTPSVSALPRSVMPGPLSRERSSRAARPRGAVTRRARAPSRACFCRLVAASVTASSASATRTGAMPMRRASRAASRRAAAATATSRRSHTTSPASVSSPDTGFTAPTSAPSPWFRRPAPSPARTRRPAAGRR